MIALFTAIETALTDLLDGAVFHDPAGADREMRFFKQHMPPKRQNAEQGEDAPCCLLHMPDFTLAKEAATLSVTADFTIYAGADLDHDQGPVELDRLLTLIRPLAAKRTNPYKLSGEILGSLPDEKHPYYFLRLQVDYRSLNNLTC